MLPGTPEQLEDRCIAAFSVSPSGAEEVGAAVAEAVRLVRESGLENETNAMFTNVEGEWDEVMAVIKSCVLRLAEDSPRVSVGDQDRLPARCHRGACVKGRDPRAPLGRARVLLGAVSSRLVKSSRPRRSPG